MSRTKKVTRQIKEKQCAHCKHADKHSLEIGTPHCRGILAGAVNIKNGICQQCKRGK